MLEVWCCVLCVVCCEVCRVSVSVPECMRRGRGVAADGEWRFWIFGRKESFGRRWSVKRWGAIMVIRLFGVMILKV